MDPIVTAAFSNLPNSNVQQKAQNALPMKEEIWSRILQEVSSRNNEATQGSVIVLGNDRGGKSSLIFHMTNGEQGSLFSSVLEYNYLKVHADPDGSYAYQLGSTSGLGPAESVNLPVWILGGKEELRPLLKFAFPPQLSKCVVLLCSSMQYPGNILPSIRKWYRQLEEAIKGHYSPEEIDQARKTQLRFWQEYVEPIESSMHVESTTSRIDSLDPVLLPPEPGVMEENCGAIVIVVLTKGDLHTELSDEQLNKVQYHVRQFCLRHGAGLVYTSAKEDKNAHLLFKYIAHRVFSLPFTHPAYIVEKDSVFVPSGWDSDQKLDIIKETFNNLEVPILPQEEEFAHHRERVEPPVEVEDEQSFLQRLAASDSGASPKRSDPTAGSGAPKPASIPLAQAGDNTLASFFNSLLKKDNQSSAASQPSAATAKQSSVANTSDAPSQPTFTGQLNDNSGPERVDDEEGELSESDLSSPAEMTPRDEMNEEKKP